MWSNLPANIDMPQASCLILKSVFNYVMDVFDLTQIMD